MTKATQKPLPREWDYSPVPDGEEFVSKIAKLEERVLQLETLVGIIVGQIAEPPNKSRSGNEPGGIRIVRPATKAEIREDVAGLLHRLGLDDLEFRVM